MLVGWGGCIAWLPVRGQEATRFVLWGCCKAYALGFSWPMSRTWETELVSVFRHSSIFFRGVHQWCFIRTLILSISCGDRPASRSVGLLLPRLRKSGLGHFWDSGLGGPPELCHFAVGPATCFCPCPAWVLRLAWRAPFDFNGEEKQRQPILEGPFDKPACHRKETSTLGSNNPAASGARTQNVCQKGIRTLNMGSLFLGTPFSPA